MSKYEKGGTQPFKIREENTLEQELLVTTRLTGIFRFAGRRRFIVPRIGGDRRGLGRWRVAGQELAGSTATKICLRK